MKFGKTLRESIYEPWKEHYIDYAKLKSLLREDKVDDEDEHPWTEQDEAAFSEELITKQLEKVSRFQEDTFHSLKDRVNAAFDALKELAPLQPPDAPSAGESPSQLRPKSSSIHKERLKEIKKELDGIIHDIRELKKFTSINYTGFHKIVKKHDRKRGKWYKVRPLMQVSMSNRPFTSEPTYSPLLKKLSIMYFIIRQHLEDGEPGYPTEPVDLENEGEVHNGERYTAHKCRCSTVLVGRLGWY
jgi:SPX domain protein involved in polyphosphate accumulation